MYAPASAGGLEVPEELHVNVSYLLKNTDINLTVNI
jgi:hypothetical protein